MRRFLPYTALALYLSVLPATAADRYGGWLLEQPRSSVFTLSFKQSVPRNGKIATSELGFICDQRDKSAHVGVLLIPVDGTFKNRQRIIPVWIRKNNDQYDSSDLLQHWKNGTEYIFLESNDDVDKLTSLLKANEVDGVKSIHFFFRTTQMRDLKQQTILLLILRGSLTALATSIRHAPRRLGVEASYTPKPNLFLSAFRFEHFTHSAARNSFAFHGIASEDDFGV